MRPFTGLGVRKSHSASHFLLRQSFGNQNIMIGEVMKNPLSGANLRFSELNWKHSKSGLPSKEEGTALGKIVTGTSIEVFFRLNKKKWYKTLESNVARYFQGIPSSVFLIFPYIWPTDFGDVLTLSFGLHDMGFCGLAACSVTRGDLATIFDKGVNCHFFDGDDYHIASILVEGLLTEEYKQRLELNLARLECPNVLLSEPEIAKLMALSCLSEGLSEVLTPRDLLQIGWAKKFHRLLYKFSRCSEEYCKTPLEDSFISKFPDLVNFIGIARLGASGFADLVSYFEKELSEAKHSVNFSNKFADLHNTFQYEADRVSPNHEFCQLIIAAMQTYRRSPKLTNYGRQLPWFSKNVNQLALTPESFTGGSSPIKYWERIPDSVLLNWGHCIDGSDVPMILPEDLDAIPFLLPTENHEEAIAAAKGLMLEAATNKQWVIPPKAYVEINTSGIQGIEFFEFPGDPTFVMFVIRDKNGEFALGCIEPASEFFFVDGLSHFEERDIINKLAGLQLLIAATIRDFWIVEEREKTFRCKISRSSASHQYQKGPKLVYLPRVRYISTPNVSGIEKDLGLTERIPHFVTAHLRRSENPSQHQLLLAKRYGFHVPEGYTFVRPHEKGKNPRQTIYKSKSALALLYSEDPKTSGSSPDWFKFEIDVKRLMQNLGFDVIHTAAAKSGDEGIDLTATKGKGLDEVNWAIQCKCYSPKRKIGPKVIREFIGALEASPRGTKGLVVTTSSFSSEAIGLAASSQIELMNGRDFASLLNKCNAE